ncbi:MAG: hypothetical protein VB024_12860 [Dysgonamonadaceae bacterium]|jgi:hypothetical protein|nr:hypothetical protein [Dysgonamonadaceae bacterium]
MENLRIELPYNKETFKREQKIIWQLRWKENKRKIQSFSIAAAIFLVIGIFVYLDDTSDYFNLVMAVSFIFLVILFISTRRVTQNNEYKLIDTIADRYEKEKMDCIYEFSDNFLKYWDKEKHLEYTWSIFGCHTTYKNYLLLLHRDNLKRPLHIFENNDLNNDKFEQIKAFIESKLEYKDCDIIF